MDCIDQEVCVRKVRTAIVASSLLCLLILAACHSPAPMGKMVWVNQTDKEQTMEFAVRGRTVLGKLHMVLMGAQVKGTYVVRKADTVLEEGTLVQEPDAYVLKSIDGKQQRLKAEKPSSLKTETGTIWDLQKR